MLHHNQHGTHSIPATIYGELAKQTGTEVKHEALERPLDLCELHRAEPCDARETLHMFAEVSHSVGK
jgi:hypothetical protein